jgi:putative CocE/NonD family hydrolase
MALPPATHSKLEFQPDLQIPMPDGVVLLANRIAPVGGEKLPIILVRDPYSFRGKTPDFISQVIAERGYQVVYQNCRGRWGSGGVFEPFQNEREDGLATLQWISEQPWFSGSVGMYGLSYWGYAQLALGAGAPPYLKALVPQMSASRIYNVFRSDGTVRFFTLLSWCYSTFVTNAKSSVKEAQVARKQQNAMLRDAAVHLPANETDRRMIGKTLPFYQSVLANTKPDDAFWAATDFSESVKDIQAPVHFVDGWYDFFLADQLKDYAALKDAGKNPYLTIGPWTHAEINGMKAGFQESFLWYDAYLKGNRDALRTSPVRIFLMGAMQWVDLPSWPPEFAISSHYLKANGALSKAPANDATPSCYRYDPADPTPSVAGAIIEGGGAKDNRSVELRKDVLTFTGESLTESKTIIGTVSVSLYVRATNEHTDFFARLCDVVPGNGKSMNICDGLVRLTPNSVAADESGVKHITIELSPTAYTFLPGHRIRLQVSSGAHPLYARNLGTGEPISSAVAMVSSDQEVFHDAAHPSCLLLPTISL